MSMLPVGIGSAEAGGYQIERSLRFNSADSANLNRTPASAGNRKTWTWSGWVKRSAFGGTQSLFARNDGSVASYLIWNSDNKLEFSSASGSVEAQVITTPVYRDASAWYHVTMALDTTQGTSSNRVKLYINGVQVTALDTASYPSQNYDGYVNTTQIHYIGAGGFGGSLTGFFNGYLTEVNFIDGQALTPSSFGETDTDTGVWKPKKYTGTYGSQGWYLNFSDNSGTTSTTLGKDSSGNGNNWTPNNFSVTAGAGNDSLVDSPTNYGTDTGVGGEVRGNYCTLNSVKPVTNSITFSNGNLQYKPGSSWSTTTYVEGTIGVLGGSTGKYYWEMSADQTGAFWTAGVALQNNTIGGSNIGTTGSVMIYDNAKYVNGTSTSSYLTSLSANEVLGVALDAATGKVWFRDSGGWLGSGDPAAGTNETGIPTGFSGATLVPVTQANSVSTVTANFGQRPFAYTAPSGFKALCTTNLPEPTIADGGEYFNTVTYTGTLTDGQGTGATQSITGVGFQPDFLWLKNRTNANQHLLVDAVRTVTNYRYLNSASTGAETTVNSNGAISALNADGFTVQNGNDTSAKANLVGRDGWNYVAWNWKANGAGSSNTAGTITSTVSVNTTSGFSIVTFTSDGATAGGTAGHGLGVAPSMVIYKGRNTVENWYVYHASLGGSNTLFLNATNASTTTGVFNSTAPTSSVIQLRQVGWGASNLVAYCFAPVAGYSAFGSYTGNGSADGPFVYTGFRPAFVMVKRTDDVNSWNIWDDKRNPYNQQNNVLYANTSAAEDTRQSDFISNGFKLRGTSTEFNASGGTYIYMAFAESPFRYSLAR